jgi:hypothetical protein
MNKLVIANGVVTLAVAGGLVGTALALHGEVASQASQAARQASRAQTSISQLQQENTSLATQLSQDHMLLSQARTALAKVPAQTQNSTNKLGICFDTSTQSFSNLTDSIMDGVNFVDNVDVTTPNLLNGVVSCPPSYTYVPVTPANNSTNSN